MKSCFVCSVYASKCCRYGSAKIQYMTFIHKMVCIIYVTIYITYKHTPLITTDTAWCLHGSDGTAVYSEDDNIILTITLSVIIHAHKHTHMYIILYIHNLSQILLLSTNFSNS